MVDIATALNNLAIAFNTLQKAEIIPSFIISPAVTEGCITNAIAPTGLKVFYISLKVRSMGTATYISVGRHGNMEERLTTVGEIYEVEAPRGAYIDTRDIMILADVDDAIVEVGGVIIPGEIL